MTDHHTIDTLLDESRTFAPAREFISQANFSDPAIYDEEIVAYWSNWANTLRWMTPWTTALEWDCPDAKWFLGGTLNACDNCVDRHVEAGAGDEVAFIWEGEPGDQRTITYAELKDDVSRIANALKALGVGKGDRVCLYMPMVPELPMAMLACARIGAIHSVVFGGFSADSLAERINDAGAKVVVTADGGWRRGQIVQLKHITDEALTMGCPTITNVLVYRRVGDLASHHWVEGRDIWWDELVPKQSADCACEPMDPEDRLYILYTSGSTGKPKGIVHSTGGYMTGVAATFKMVFDHKPGDLYWCTADCGWVTGHSYVVYGPLANRAKVFLYEGAPDTPDKDRFWRMIERHRITILYTAPTAIRAFMKWGDHYPEDCDLSSLRLLGTVGEPINPEAWVWYHKKIGGGRCPIVDTWWQTETGAIMISPLPGITETKPGSATRPLPGVQVGVLDEEGEILTQIGSPSSVGGKGDKPHQMGEQVGGFLALLHPWPSMLRGIWGDHERYVDTYWSRFPGKYFAGDGCKVDEDGYFWLLGRVDDIMLVAGHNISTMEVESALVDHPAVAEAAVIGKTHDLKGQSICAFVIIKEDFKHEHPQVTPDVMIKALKDHVAAKIGPIARPDDIFITADVPKTRSGKIMRRLLRDVAEGRALGDTTTLADPNVVAALRDKYEESEA